MNIITKFIEKNKLLLAIVFFASITSTIKASGEEIIECASSGDAFSKALRTIGDKLNLANDIVWGRLHAAKSKVVGIKYQDPNATDSKDNSFTLRIDYDPTKGLHLNVTLRNDQFRKKIAYTYPYIGISTAEADYNSQLNALQEVVKNLGRFDISPSKEVALIQQLQLTTKAVVNYLQRITGGVPQDRIYHSVASVAA